MNLKLVATLYICHFCWHRSFTKADQQVSDSDKTRRCWDQRRCRSAAALCLYCLKWPIYVIVVYDMSRLQSLTVWWHIYYNAACRLQSQVGWASRSAFQRSNDTADETLGYFRLMLESAHQGKSVIDGWTQKPVLLKAMIIEHSPVISTLYRLLATETKKLIRPIIMCLLLNATL